MNNFAHNCEKMFLKPFVLQITMSRYSAFERAQCAIWYGELKSATMVQRRFRAEFDIPWQDSVPDRKSIVLWHTNLLQTGSVYGEPAQRSKPAKTAENIAKVKDHFLSATLNLNRETIRRILKELKWHPYKVKIVQKLYPEDLAARLDFAECELERLRSDELRLEML